MAPPSGCRDRGGGMLAAASARADGPPAAGRVSSRARGGGCCPPTCQREEGGLGLDVQLLVPAGRALADESTGTRARNVLG